MAGDIRDVISCNEHDVLQHMASHQFTSTWYYFIKSNNF